MACCVQVITFTFTGTTRHIAIKLRKVVIVLIKIPFHLGWHIWHIGGTLYTILSKVKGGVFPPYRFPWLELNTLNLLVSLTVWWYLVCFVLTPLEYCACGHSKWETSSWDDKECADAEEDDGDDVLTLGRNAFFNMVRTLSVYALLPDLPYMCMPS